MYATTDCDTLIPQTDDDVERLAVDIRSKLARTPEGRARWLLENAAQHAEQLRHARNARSRRRGVHVVRRMLDAIR